MTQPYVPPCQDSRILAEPCPREAGRLPTPSAQMRVLAACVLASSMAFIDGSALTVALPALKQEFGGSVAVVQWVLNGYVLALAALTMSGGAMADAFGRARILMWGTAAFALASAACALAPSPLVLIGARVAQGIAAALVTPASLALIGELFAKDDRGRAIGIWSGASSLAEAGGPLLGGWLVVALSWRALFWINLPMAARALLLLAGLPKRSGDAEGRFDILGSVLLALALCAVAFALSAIAPTDSASGHGAGDANWMLFGAMFVAAIALLSAFWIWQGRATHPLLPRYIFSSRTFAGLNVATMGLYTGLSIVFFLLPFELIERRGMSAVEAGLVFLPFTLCVAFLSKWFGQLADRLGLRRMLLAGSLLAAIGFAAFATDPSNLAWRSLYLPMAISGLGFAVLVAPLTAGVMASVDDADEGLASGINNTASRVAQMIGGAVAALFAATSAGHVAGLWVAVVASVLGAAAIAFMVARNP